MDKETDKTFTSIGSKRSPPEVSAITRKKKIEETKTLYKNASAALVIKEGVPFRIFDQM